MCTTCGCGGGDTVLPVTLSPEMAHAARLVRLERDLLAHNASVAAENRAAFTQARTLALNLMSSPCLLYTSPSPRD